MSAAATRLGVIAVVCLAGVGRLHDGAAISSSPPRPCSRRTRHRRGLGRGRWRTPAAEIGWKRILPRCRAAGSAGARAGQQPRSAHRHAQRRGGARAVPHPARGSRARHRCRGHGEQPARAGELCRRRGRASSTRTLFGAGFGVSAFELDLFGRVRSLRRAALEDYFRLEETRTAAQLAAGVGSRQCLADADRGSRAAARSREETRDSQRKSFDLTKLRFDAGVSSEIDLHRSETAWREAEVDIAAQTRRVAQDRNALALLVGEPLPRGDRRRRTRHRRADLLERRCRRACRRNCWCAVPTCARPSTRSRPRTPTSARRAPRFSRASSSPGFYGNASDDLSALFQSGHTSWSFTPQVRLPIFSGGANLAALESRQRAQAHRDRALRAIDPGRVPRSGRRAGRARHARRPVARAGGADARERNQLQARRHAVSRRRGQLSRARSSRSAICTPRNGNSSRRGWRAPANLVQLYTALGGGWKAVEEECGLPIREILLIFKSRYA